MPSAEFKKLKSNCLRLEKEFLNFSRRYSGNYSISELTRCRAFISFVHAEIEFYLESIALKILSKVEKHWVKHKFANNAIAALLAYKFNSDISYPNNLGEFPQDKRMNEVVRRMISSHRADVSRNHGIKPKNLAALFIPLGLDVDLVSEPLLILLMSFGSRRGEMVHTSNSVSLLKIRDPFSDEASDVSDLLQELELFDAIILKLR
jgi:hypothetical protein